MIIDFIFKSFALRKYVGFSSLEIDFVSFIIEEVLHVKSLMYPTCMLLKLIHVQSKSTVVTLVV